MLKENSLEENLNMLLWLRGSLEASYSATSHEESFTWRQDYLSDLLEKKFLETEFSKVSFEKRLQFCQTLALFHGHLFNASKMGRALNMPDWKVKSYLNVLEKNSIVRKLFPWKENLNKRQVKSFKVYFRDSGVLHTLLDVKEESALRTHPQKELLWEGFVLQEILKQFQLTDQESFFWKTQAGAELSLFFIKNGKRLGFAFGYTSEPKITLAMRIALHDLKLDHLYLIFPGRFTFSLSEKITAQSLETLSSIAPF